MNQTSKNLPLLLMFLFGISVGIAYALSDPWSTNRVTWQDEIQASQATSETPEKSNSQIALGFSVSEVLKKKSMGLNYENHSAQDKARLKAQTESFIAFRKGKLDAERRGTLLAECVVRPAENPFCSYMNPLAASVEDSKTENRAQETLRRIASRLDSLELSESLERGEFEKTRTSSEAEIRFAIQQFKGLELLKPLGKKVAESNACPSDYFLAALGRKLEESLPDPEIKTLIKSIYSKTLACGDPKNESNIFARYRLSLFSIWDQGCPQALPLLKGLAAQEEHDFTSRSLYWHAWCLRETGDKLGFEIAKNRLVKFNPLGYHTLALEGAPISAVTNMMHQNESKVLFRSLMKPEINSTLLAAELLIQSRAPEYAREVLKNLPDLIETCEPGVQLYGAILAERLGSSITQFRIISKYLRLFPSEISRDTLTLLFPMKLFSAVSQHREKADPFLITALIRQESGFNPLARSPAGALGLMQVMPQTARKVHGRRLNSNQLLATNFNIQIGVKEFAFLLRRYNGDGELALAAYNAGPGNVDRWIERYPTSNKMLFIDMIPFSETRDYVALIGRNYFWYLSLYAPKILDSILGTDEPLDDNLIAKIHVPSKRPRFTVFQEM